MKYLTILFLVVFFGCKKEKTQPVLNLPTTKVTSINVCGCTDSNALNYNKNANINDGSCKHDYDEIVGKWQVHGKWKDEWDGNPYIPEIHNYDSTFIMNITKYGNDQTSVKITFFPDENIFTYKNHHIASSTRLTITNFVINTRNDSFGCDFCDAYGCVNGAVRGTLTGIRIK